MGILGLVTYGSYLGFQYHKKLTDGTSATHRSNLGEIVHLHNGIPIYSNGDEVYNSHGKHFSNDGYYYGRKWQCVEFIKRYLYDAKGHKMPDLWGHAKQFFDPNIHHAAINPARNLTQFRNHNNEPPKPDDLLVWGGKYGHVAIVTEVYTDHIIIAQQNIKNLPVVKIPLTITAERNYILGEPSDSNKPLGWLRTL